jgi:hypothetical protein
MMTNRRLIALRAALVFLQLPPRALELRLLHRWLDPWAGLGLVVVGVERPGLRFSLSHIRRGRVASNVHGASDEAQPRSWQYAATTPPKCPDHRRHSAATAVDGGP